MNEPVRIVQVGIGGYGSYLLSFLLDAPAERHIRIVGVVDPAPRQAEERLEELARRGIPRYDDLDAFFAADEADLALVCSPIALHADHVCALLARDVNVLCEKPVAATLADGRRMVAAAAASRAFAAVGFQWSFSQPIQDLKRDIMAGDLGAPRSFSSLVCWPRPRSYYERNKWAGRQHDLAGRAVYDSPVANATAHFLHNCFYLLGDAPTASAMPRRLAAECYRANPIETYDAAALRCQLEHGVTVHFLTAHAVEREMGPLLAYRFERADVFYAAKVGDGLVARWHDGRMRRYGEPEATPGKKIWDCVQAVRSGGAIACPLPAGLPHLTVANAVHAACPQATAIAEEYLRPGTWNDSPLTWVRGMEAALVHCFATGLQPAEMGLWPWARPGGEVDLDGFDGLAAAP